MPTARVTRREPGCNYPFELSFDWVTAASSTTPPDPFRFETGPLRYTSALFNSPTSDRVSATTPPEESRDKRQRAARRSGTHHRGNGQSDCSGRLAAARSGARSEPRPPVGPGTASEPAR